SFPIAPGTIRLTGDGTSRPSVTAPSRVRRRTPEGGGADGNADYSHSPPYPHQGHAAPALTKREMRPLAGGRISSQAKPDLGGDPYGSHSQSQCPNGQVR